MKIRKSILLSVLVAVLFTNAIGLLTQRSRSVGPALSSPDKVEEARPAPARLVAVPAARAIPRTSAASGDGVLDLPEVSGQPAKRLRVPAELVLATVNDKQIRLGDLIPLEGTEKVMTPDEYESRLNRAIEMEMTFQAAAAQGVNLTVEQKRRVDGIAQKYGARLQQYKKEGISWSSATPAQVEFERRLTAALMLQQNFVAREAGVAPSSDAATQGRYEQARSEVLSRLQAGSDIRLWR